MQLSTCFALAGIALFFLGQPSAQAQLTRQANATMTFPASLPASTQFTTQNALGTLTFNAPIDCASIPGVSNRLFVVERNSGIQIVNLDTLTKSTFLEMSTNLTDAGRPLNTSSECGILSLTFHPNYNQNGYFYVFYSVNLSGQRHQRLARFTAVGTPGTYNAATTADFASEQPIISQRDEAGNHNGGDITFGPDGYLYFTAGDEGPQYDGADNGRRIAKDFFGAVFRIDVDQKPGSLAPNAHDESSTGTVGDSAIHPGTYRVPPDNPFVALAQGAGNATYNGFTFTKSAIRTEIYSIGYRNPWRMSFDLLTGRLFVADVGQDTYEEVSIVTNGFNAGWSWKEGFHDHTPATGPSTPPSGFLGAPPIYEYDHTNDGIGNDAIIYGSSITGGVVYRGDRLPELYGAYLFCDYNTGIIAALRENANGTWSASRLGSDNNISGWGYDPRNNDALLCDLGSGTVDRLARSSPTGTNPPATLSAAGVFSNLQNLTPNDGIVPYAPNVSFWSDYAIKSRWFSITNLTDTIGFSENGNWSFPTGMVWIKHFDIDLERGNPATRRKLETRILVKTTNDIYGLSYRWNNVLSGTQSDATLVAEEGLSEAIPGSSPSQFWRFPSRTECKICHSSTAGFALSFHTRQLNRNHPYGVITTNQVSALSGANYFSTPVANIANLPALAAADDATASLEWRVRSYLAANCVQCHQPGGGATGNWDARPTVPTDLANLIDGILVNDGGDPTNRFAKPGDTAHSMLVKRLQGNGVPRMPPLATSERDLAAEQLVIDWITQSLPSRQSFAQWQTSNFGSTGNPNAAATADPDADGERNALEFLRYTAPNSPTAPLNSGLSTSVSGGNFILEFQQPANRAVLVETTTDFVSWSIWNVAGNAPSYPPAAINRTLIGPMNGLNRYFRLRLSEF